MSNDELAEWWAFYIIEPFGPIREDLRAGRITAMIANTIPQKPGSEPFSAEDFFPELAGRGPKKLQSKEEQLRNLQMWAIAYSAADVPIPSNNVEAKG